MLLNRQMSPDGQFDPSSADKHIRIPAHLGYRVGPKGGYILWDKRTSNGNDGQEWYASYREKKKYNLLRP
ncbi:hypothetical protein [Spirosoma sp. KNUC1025]|uniref:hypothetical protein n=1 Tax=Spirosoma sp. KNUC1025 TaxID=2894082 RepID=UPI00386FC2E2|nr:hypothetical protein LN737_23075 [Spirosoma sp. KNUC1025]